MVEQSAPVPPGEISDNDKLMALLSYLIWIVAVVVLLSEGGKRPYQRYHAVQAIAVTVALTVVFFVVFCILAAVTFWIGGLGGVCAFPVLLVLIYYAVLAYQGKYFTVPVVTDFIRGQGWIPQV